jgi:glutamine transport system permease protein
MARASPMPFFMHRHADATHSPGRTTRGFMAFQFKPEVMLDTAPLLWDGIELTIIITVLGLVFGFIIGTLVGLGRISRNRLCNAVAVSYVEAIRGTPLIVQVMFLYFGLPLVLGIRIPPVTAGVVAIAVNSGAYIAEIVRGSIQSINTGQMEAGRSIGLTHLQTMLYIIWPQAFKRMIPPLGNQFIISLKDTSLLVVIGVGELTRQGQEIIAVNFRAFEVWLTVAIMYLCMTLTLSQVLRMYERKLNARTSR